MSTRLRVALPAEALLHAVGPVGEPLGGVVDVRRSLSAIARRRWVVAEAAVAALVFAALATLGPAPRYTAAAQAFVSVSHPDKRSPNVLTSGSLYITARMSSYAALGTSTRVLDAAAAALHGARSPAVLQKEVSSTAVVDTAFLQVRVTDADPTVAAQVADTVATEAGRLIEDLENGTVSVALASPADRPISPSNRRMAVNSAVALAGGLVLGCALAVLLDLVQTRRRQSQEGGGQQGEGQQGEGQQGEGQLSERQQSERGSLR